MKLTQKWSYSVPFEVLLCYSVLSSVHSEPESFTINHFDCSYLCFYSVILFSNLVHDTIIFDMAFLRLFWWGHLERNKKNITQPILYRVITVTTVYNAFHLHMIVYSAFHFHMTLCNAFYVLMTVYFHVHGTWQLIFLLSSHWCHTFKCYAEEVEDIFLHLPGHTLAWWQVT